ncbi:MAG: MaoC/PaaZ C-terminal domain-containing protein [Alphaproteobacteria bacterium]
MKSFKRNLPVMSKEHYVRFAGVVGDFNPIHYDLEFAKRFNLPAVISQGPLTYALALDALAAEIGLDKIKSFKARITSPVFPDTALTVVCDDGGAVTVVDGKTNYLTGSFKVK